MLAWNSKPHHRRLWKIQCHSIVHITPINNFRDVSSPMWVAVSWISGAAQIGMHLYYAGITLGIIGVKSIGESFGTIGWVPGIISTNS